MVVQIVLARGAMEPWLRVHGKLKRPEMNKKQKLELRECFEIFDPLGSGKVSNLAPNCTQGIRVIIHSFDKWLFAGVIPAEELPLAFTVLGMNVKKAECDAATEEFNADKPVVLISLATLFFFNKNMGLN